MNTFVLIFFRLYGALLNWFPQASQILKRGLVFLLIKKSKKKYVAATKYFDFKAMGNTVSAGPAA